MSKNTGKIGLTCSIIFFLASMLCLGWFVLYSYLAVPKISLKGDKEVILELNGQYTEQGARASLDNRDISKKIKIDNPLDTGKVGVYDIKYSVTNNKGKKKQIVVRTVKVRETEKPTITLKKETSIKVQYGSTYKDPGYKANDNYDGDITDKVEVQGEVDTHQIGAYKLYYTVADSSENVATVVRTVNVVDTKAPSIKLNGDSYTTVKLKSTYKDQGCTAIDNHDGDVSNKVTISGKVNTSIPGYYTVYYTVKDSFGNKATASRKVQVGTKQQIDDANHILVSISEQKLWFYQDGVLQLTSNVVTGTLGVNDTPKGTFRIQYKATSVYLRGPDYKTFVNYWMPIYGDIGLHDASWRSSFGGYIYHTAGSHGCINLPYSTAQYIFYNAPTGYLVKVV